MMQSALNATGAWPVEQVEGFLKDYRAPLRLAVSSESGFPMILSLWYRYEAGKILCATTREAKVVRCLESDPRCGFELAPNEPPYFGVRGRGRVSISTDGAPELLGELVDRYLESRESKLARWLLARSEQEVILSIEIDWITSWDYRDRMSA